MKLFHNSFRAFAVPWTMVAVCLVGFLTALQAQEKPLPAAGAGLVSTEAPPGAPLVLTLRGEGVQIYTCTQRDAYWVWQLKGPQASLLDEAGKPVGKHFAGPTWQMDDGSAVQGTLMASQKQVTAIPWLLLSARQTGGPGVLAKVKYIRRTETVGGRAPAVGCDAEHLQVETSVPYSAKYSFFGDTK